MFVAHTHTQKKNAETNKHPINGMANNIHFICKLGL